MRVGAVMVLVTIVAGLIWGTLQYMVPTTSRAGDGSAVAGDSAITSIAPDPRVVWKPFDVGGFGLCNRDTCITVPPGSILWVPAKADGTTAN